MVAITSSNDPSRAGAEALSTTSSVRSRRHHARAQDVGRAACSEVE
jgi:hypothetical protein